MITDPNEARAVLEYVDEMAEHTARAATDGVTDGVDERVASVPFVVVVDGLDDLLARGHQVALTESVRRLLDRGALARVHVVVGWSPETADAKARG